MSKGKSERSKHADTVIRNHVIWSMGAGFIPVIMADVLAVSALQLDMIRQLCRVYEVDFSETRGKAIVTSLTSSAIARVGAGSAVKLIPILGSYLGGVTVSVFAGASTYALGEVFKKHFESGGTVLDFDPERLKKMYKEKFEKGKKVAKQMKDEEAEATEETPQEIKRVGTVAGQKEKPQKEDDQKDVLDRLRELAELRDNGIISEEEFQDLKQKLIAAFK